MIPLGMISFSLDKGLFKQTCIVVYKPKQVYLDRP